MRCIAAAIHWLHAACAAVCCEQQQAVAGCAAVAAVLSSNCRTWFICIQQSPGLIPLGMAPARLCCSMKIGTACFNNRGCTWHIVKHALLACHLHNMPAVAACFFSFLCTSVSKHRKHKHFSCQVAAGPCFVWQSICCYGMMMGMMTIFATVACVHDSAPKACAWAGLRLPCCSVQPNVLCSLCN